MERREYDMHELKVRAMILRYAHDNDIEREWVNRILIDILQGYTKRFEDD